MTFIIFKKENRNNKQFYLHTDEFYKLAGCGLIYNLWIERDKPINCGWTISASDILKKQNEKYSADSQSLIIDFHPSSKNRIGLIEIENIHLYTFGQNGKSDWTPIMLELRNVYYEKYKNTFTVQEKREIIAELEVEPKRKRIVEFLYLNGNELNWNWGRNGMTNAAFLHEETIKYFSPFFCIK